MQLSREEQALIEGIDQQRMLDQTLAWSAINSGTRNLDGVARQGQAFADLFAGLPGEVTLCDPTPVTAMGADGVEVELPHGKHLVLSVRPDAERRLLLTGHMDTVFPEDSSFQTPEWLDDETVNGPGVTDMKGGVGVIAHALTAFERSEHASRIGYDVMINADEETGSLSSAALIASLAEGKYAALTYEPSTLPDGTLAHARGGSGNYSVVITGRSAHAGRNPDEGRNAIVAAADIAVRLKAMGHADMSVNPAKIEGGAANNVVPDHAVLRFNIRPKTTQAAETFESNLKTLLRSMEVQHEVAIHLHGGVTRPPKPVDARAQKLFDLVCSTSADMGRPIGTRPTGGVCDGNNIAAKMVPVVDTMGVRGGAIHSADEYLIVESLSERAALSAVVLHRLASGEHL
ncbi:hydrolase [Paraurantiacibacter namhicola]|uniref:Carboxypeptidase G2 n=1 Tax=Paraurantiacibacter namhicola TaxID=645517 RepID=A0A1C7DAR8_9SPHN|nr:hydrolase [Paraurantiacibacter namhicola]ANU08393.1 Carboxypeptidase G2 precursor [Paraurantiacibacter namhicola]